MSSSQWPRLGVILLTYNREEYAKRTIKAFLDNVQYSGEILFHIADDGSEDTEYATRLREYAGGWPQVQATGQSNSHRGGYGANYNAATTVVHPIVDLVLPLEDDWELVKKLDLDPLAWVLSTEPRIGMIRMGYLSYTRPVFGELMFRKGQNFLLLDPLSGSEYIFSGHPRLETVEWARRVGPWPERIRAGEVELDVCMRMAARTGVVWPLSLSRLEGDLFKHIGIDSIKDAGGLKVGAQL